MIASIKFTCRNTDTDTAARSSSQSPLPDETGDRD